MIIVKNVRTIGGEVVNHEIPSPKHYEIDAEEKLLLFPGVIDSHISFGPIDSQNWNLAIESAIRGGITTAIEIQNDLHSSKKDLEERNHKIAKNLLDLEIPLNYFNYVSYSRRNLEKIDQLGKEKQLIKGVVIHLDDEKRETLDDYWEDLFQLAAHEDIPIVINSNNENSKSPLVKDKTLLEKAISYVEKFSNRLYVLNVATKKEIDLIQEARKKALLVYAETTPYHLFHGDSSKESHLWEALNNNVIEAIGSGHSFNQQDQDRVLYSGGNFSLSDPIFFLPFLLTAVNEKKITIDKLAQLTSQNLQDILELSRTQDFVLINLEKEDTIQRIHSHLTTNIKLKGWPAYTIVQGQIFSSPKRGYQPVRMT